MICEHRFHVCFGVEVGSVELADFGGENGAVEVGLGRFWSGGIDGGGGFEVVVVAEGGAVGAAGWRGGGGGARGCGGAGEGRWGVGRAR